MLQAWVAQIMVMWRSANDPRTANDPQIGPQMITERVWSPYWTANDPDQKIRNGIDGEVVWIRNWCEWGLLLLFFISIISELNNEFPGI